MEHQRTTTECYFVQNVMSENVFEGNAFFNVLSPSPLRELGPLTCNGNF